MIADRAFSARVLERVAADEERRSRRAWLRCLLPLMILITIGGAWAIALLDGAVTLRLSIRVIAWLSLVGAHEEHLARALLGPLASLPLLVSLLLLVAALAWVRVHQADPHETEARQRGGDE